jgi:hypothetical protein
MYFLLILDSICPLADWPLSLFAKHDGQREEITFWEMFMQQGLKCAVNVKKDEFYIKDWEKLR